MSHPIAHLPQPQTPEPSRHPMAGAPLHRRRFLTGLGIAAGGAAGWSLGLAPAPASAAPASAALPPGALPPGSPLMAAAAAPRPWQWTAAASENGWPVRPGRGRADLVETYQIEGSNASVALLSGDVATVLTHVARRLHYELHALEPGDIRGHTTNRTVAARYESNHLSGTAIAILCGLYPLGARGGLFPAEVAVIRDILAECQGVVAWGGDAATPKEGHFQIGVRPGNARLRRVARQISGWAEHPGRGAGTLPDPFTPDRRRAARALKPVVPAG